MSTDTKPSNPKQSVGASKLPLELAPDTVQAYLSLAFLEGALKYGRYNWRIAGVQASTYIAAERRHVSKWWNGQNEDPLTRVHHLANAMACLGILLDAEVAGMLNDDRPPAAPFAELVDGMLDRIAHLKQLFKDHNPKQYTIADTPPVLIESAAPILVEECTPEQIAELNHALYAAGIGGTPRAPMDDWYTENGL